MNVSYPDTGVFSYSKVQEYAKNNSKSSIDVWCLAITGTTTITGKVWEMSVNSCWYTTPMQSQDLLSDRMRENTCQFTMGVFKVMHTKS